MLVFFYIQLLREERKELQIWRMNHHLKKSPKYKNGLILWDENNCIQF